MFQIRIWKQNPPLLELNLIDSICQVPCLIFYSVLLQKHWNEWIYPRVICVGIMHKISQKRRMSSNTPLTNQALEIYKLDFKQNA